MEFKKKDKFLVLNEDFRDGVNGMTEAEIRDSIARIALDQAALMEAKDLDQDLADKKELAKEAGAVYREGTKANKLKVEFLRRKLGELGKPNGESGIEFVEETENEMTGEA